MEILTDPGRFAEKEQTYIAVRTSEGRMYTDDQVRCLPDISLKHRYSGEWAFRKKSFQRLTEYLKINFHDRQLNILDIGCGNGWMSHQLYLAGHCVTAVDVNMCELRQAEKVFGAGISWVYADIFDLAFAAGKYDVIILAASVQYFPDLGMLTQRLRSFLTDGGQIHLTDSVFYGANELQKARQRSFEYFTRIGHMQMNRYYFHHSRPFAKELGYRKRNNVGLNFVNRIHALEWWVLAC